jgi:hypothetical protein
MLARCNIRFVCLLPDLLARLLDKYVLRSDRLALLVAFRLFAPMIVCMIIRLFSSESANVPLARLINVVDILYAC